MTDMEGDMKPPGWLVIAPKSQWRKSEDGQAEFTVRVRLWHPGFWLDVIRTLARRPR